MLLNVCCKFPDSMDGFHIMTGIFKRTNYILMALFSFSMSKEVKIVPITLVARYQQGCITEVN